MAMKQKSLESNKKAVNLRTKEVLVIKEIESPSALENETRKVIEKGIRR